jgi:hypothetical protein
MMAPFFVGSSRDNDKKWMGIARIEKPRPSVLSWTGLTFHLGFHLLIATTSEQSILL